MLCHVIFAPSFHQHAVVEVVSVGDSLGVRLRGWLERAHHHVIEVPDGAFHQFRYTRYVCENVANEVAESRIRKALPDVLPDAPRCNAPTIDGMPMTGAIRQANGVVEERCINTRDNDPVIHDICVAVLDLAQGTLTDADSQAIFAVIGEYLER